MWEITLDLDFDYNAYQALSRYKDDPLFTVEDNLLRFGLRLDNLTEVVIMFYDRQLTIRSTGDKKTVIEKVKHILNINCDYNNIYNHFINTNLKDLFIQYKGSTLCLDINLYESLMRAIIHQQISMKAAYSITRKFIQQFGQVINDVYYFPEAKTISNLTIEEIKACGINQSKATYLQNVARMINEKTLVLEDFIDKDEILIRNELIKIKGIGNWTIDCFLFFGLGRLDLLLYGDLGLIKGIQKYFNLEDKPTKNLIDVYSNEWHPYASYATFYLWKYLSEN